MRPPRIQVSVLQQAHSKKASSSTTILWQGLALCFVILLIPWAIYVNYHPRFASLSSFSLNQNDMQHGLTSNSVATSLGQVSGTSQELLNKLSENVANEKKIHTQAAIAAGIVTESTPLFAHIPPPPPPPPPKGAKVTMDNKNKIGGGGGGGGEIKNSKKMNKAEVEKATLEAVGTLSTILHSPSYGSFKVDRAKRMPVQGPIPTNGAVPLYGIQHTGGDAIFALACNYPKNFYQRFVGSLRKSGYTGDIVLAVSPEEKMKPGVGAYIKKMNVIGYGFDVDCIGKDNCKLKDDFLGYPDPRPHRTFANIRYALYEYWLRHYSEQSYILILDFRDTFFQLDPFGKLPPVADRKPIYDLRMYAENHEVKNIGKCVYNSLWIGRCFGKPALADLKHQPVICSGSTLGSYMAVDYYIRTMLASMDTVKCWLKGIESDQGYQNYLFYNGYFNTAMGNATLFHQGEDVVNTIGAMNGFRVPKDKKGPLDTFWKIRDKEGYILNYDGTRSACIHQWDRWYKDLHKFVDTKTF